MLEVFWRERMVEVDVVVEAVVHRRSDGELRFRVQALQGLSHQMACGMSERVASAFVVPSEQAQCRIFVDRSADIDDLAVEFSRVGISRESCGNVFSDIINGGPGGIFPDRAVFQCDVHVFSLYPVRGALKKF